MVPTLISWLGYELISLLWDYVQPDILQNYIEQFLWTVKLPTKRHTDSAEAGGLSSGRLMYLSSDVSQCKRLGATLDATNAATAESVLFQQFDGNGDGFVDHKELKDQLQQLGIGGENGPEAAGLVVDELIKTFDTDVKDRRLSKAECNNMVCTIFKNGSMELANHLRLHGITMPTLLGCIDLENDEMIRIERQSQALDFVLEHWATTKDCSGALQKIFEWWVLSPKTSPPLLHCLCVSG